MSNRLPDWMARDLSLPRLRRYIRAAHGDARVAERLYWWNAEASAALVGPLHCLELALRNALHNALVRHHGRPDWWEAAPLNERSRGLVDSARRSCGRRLRRTTPDDVVAELTLGFWVSLLSAGYDRHFWVPVLNSAFPHYRGPRGRLYHDLTSLALLRNRVMHHEPVHHRHLAADHDSIYRVLGYLSPEFAKEARAMDRFPDVLADRAAVVGGTRPPRF
ncbi:hypothetical protein [Streptomyces caniscabiei]|uniref:Abi-like protein n=1 Tax=Streptomyces caniscabiei TaxID=2746961 RepID=A0A927L3H5_9ACTN|nr:hypothetical protein [Streptomyces caniscabiei]MBD9701032.1 hypothetical protein [Streptomyces caniscabiei]MBD9724822.1 hypothetical protein [Streptomyces caniscabiei]MDX3510607.1 hypothetical protein [Streptomyces caniscabiei]MDX3720690.1 hypothetical protein [Streptomyces caniscabiei]MDX3732547.1 hypothetical protein [Streptomyces caniscabiei]